MPESAAASEIARRIPEASRYILAKSKQHCERFGVWERPEPYHGAGISEDIVRSATLYNTDDDLDCSRQSPNKKDAVKIMRDGESQGDREALHDEVNPRNVPAVSEGEPRFKIKID